MLRLEQNLTVSSAAQQGKKPELVLLLPAFLELIVHLHTELILFSVAFRTFGEDLGRVALEWNAFCEGRHPLYPHFRIDGSDGKEDHRLRASNMRHVIYRDSSGTLLAVGTDLLPKGSREWGALATQSKNRCGGSSPTQCAAASHDTRNGR